MATRAFRRTAVPVWTCEVDVQQRLDFPVFAKAEMIFTDDSTPPRVHEYVEDRVVDPSPAAIKKLCRDQLEQLQRMDQLGNNPLSGEIDLTPDPVPEPDPEVVALQEKRAAYAADLQLRIQHLKAMELKLLPEDDGEAAIVKDRLDRAIASDDRALVLSLIG